MTSSEYQVMQRVVVIFSPASFQNLVQSSCLKYRIAKALRNKYKGLTNTIKSEFWRNTKAMLPPSWPTAFPRRTILPAKGFQLVPISNEPYVLAFILDLRTLLWRAIPYKLSKGCPFVPFFSQGKMLRSTWTKCFLACTWRLSCKSRVGWYVEEKYIVHKSCPLKKSVSKRSLLLRRRL